MHLKQSEAIRHDLRSRQKIKGIPQPTVTPSDLEFLRARDLVPNMNHAEQEELLHTLNLIGGYDGIIKKIADDALDSLPHRDDDWLNHLRGVAVGAVDDSLPYARSLPVAGGGYVLWVSRGFMALIHDMSRIVVGGTGHLHTLPKEQRGPYLVMLARKALWSCIFFWTGRQLPGNRYFELLSDLELQADYLRNRVQRFCVLHEFAHFLISLGKIVDVELLDTIAHEHCCSDKQIEELTADAWATQMCFQSKASVTPDPILRLADLVWTRVAPCVFFAITNFVEQIDTWLGGPANQTNTNETSKRSNVADYPVGKHRYQSGLNVAETQHSGGPMVEPLCKESWQLLEVLSAICGEVLSNENRQIWVPG